MLLGCTIITQLLYYMTILYSSDCGQSMQNLPNVNADCMCSTMWSVVQTEPGHTGT